MHFSACRLASVQRPAGVRLAPVLAGARLAPAQRRAGSRLAVIALALAIAASGARAAEPSQTGQSGLISMPDARLAPDGTWNMGLSYLRPYEALWSSLTFLPWLELSGRFTRIFGVPGFRPGPNIDYGDFKDKSINMKLRLLDEDESRPSVVFGAQDFIGTNVFRSYYAAMSRRFGDFDATLGYGARRIDGLFGGVRYRPVTMPGWALVAEYDAFNYRRDLSSDLSGAAGYRKSPAFGIEYKWDWFGTQIAAAHGKLAFNGYVTIPLERKEFIPKIDEPAPDARVRPRPTAAQWSGDANIRQDLAQALYEQDFRDLHVRYEDGRLEAALANIRISQMPRAVGRAARILLSLAPLETREIRVTYTNGALPLATYSFFDVPRLQRYFNGMLSRARLADYVAVEYARPGGGTAARDRDEALAAFEEPLPVTRVQRGYEGNLLALRSGDGLTREFLLRPAFNGYFNDPSGAFRYDVSALASYDRRLGRGLFFDSDVKYSLFENVSQVNNPSNSVLPHVRTDVADYKRGGRLKVLRALVNKYGEPAERVYTRVSAGVYEEMFSGAGGQVLYLPRGARWGVDLAVDWLKQRDFRGLLGYRDYSTVTAIGSFNYRMTQGLTGTLRVGRFLAKDEGARVELKRRFRSGFELGAWYTVTNGNDITSPGSPSAPYHDKGVFVSIPLNTMLTRDTQQAPAAAIAPWTRDVGQMVVSPGDLYRLLEKPLAIDMQAGDGLSGLGDREDDDNLPDLGSSARAWPDFLGDDLFSAGKTARKWDWWQTAAFGAGLTLASATLDRRADRFARDHAASSWLRQGRRFGNALPVVALGAAAVLAYDDSRPRAASAGVAALEAGGAAVLVSEALKYAVGRARPLEGLGNRDFSAFSSRHGNASFPSRHAMVMWAAATPFAIEYDMPWLYGLAAVTNAARVASREHWVSDTVAGSVIGYWLGRVAWEAGRESARSKGPRLAIGPNMVGVEWKTY